MFPIRDNLPTQHPPYVTVGLIVINAVVFLFTGMGQNRATSLEYGFIPAQLLQSPDQFESNSRERFTNAELQAFYQELQARGLRMRGGVPRDVQERIVRRTERLTQLVIEKPAYLKLFSCMFLHGGWMHVIGNMLFLWIFGNNIEDRLGPILFAIFYLATGVVATLSHAFFAPDFIPLIGASGAVSGVMGGYLLLHPTARVLAVAPIGYYPMTVSLPAWIFMIFYIVIQNLYPATFSIGDGGVAYWAHIGGFAAGLATIKLLPHRKLLPQTEVDDHDADLVIR